LFDTDSLDVLQLRTSLNVAGLAKETWCSTSKIAFRTKIYTSSKITVLKIISKFPNKSWNVNGLNYLLKKLRDTGTIARQPGSGRHQSARTVENVDTVNDL